MSSVLDAFPYPWPDKVAQELHITLTRLYPTPPDALPVAERAGIERGLLNTQQSGINLWHEILTKAATDGILRELVQTSRDLLNDRSPRRPFLDELLANQRPRIEGERRHADGTPAFVAGDDSVTEPEALLYQDDLTIQIGRVPALIETLERLVKLAPAVCRLVVDVHGLGMHGSAFRIGPDLLLTNWHVLHDDGGTRASAVTAEFVYEDDGKGGALTPVLVPCDVASIIANEADDWAVIRAKEPLRDTWPVVKLSLAAEPTISSSAYIVQHPGGDRKRLGFVRNQVSSFDDRVLHYLTDTQEGSSGSPVFDAEGKLIGLHHAGGTPQQVVGKPPLSKNEGIRIPRVVAGLTAQSVATP